MNYITKITERVGTKMILNDKQKTILQSFTGYRSPIDEESLYKGIDIRCLKLFKKHFKGLFIYRPRGGRWSPYNCRMRDAKTFAIYKKEDRRLPRYWVA